MTAAKAVSAMVNAMNKGMAVGACTARHVAGAWIRSAGLAGDRGANEYNAVVNDHVMGEAS